MGLQCISIPSLQFFLLHYFFSPIAERILMTMEL